jgi:UPF0755 protein
MSDHLESSIFGDHDGQVAHQDGRDGDPLEPRTPAPGGNARPLTRREIREAEQRARRSGGAGRADRSRGPAHKPSPWRRVLVIVLALAVVGGGLAVSYTYLRPVVEGVFAANDYPGPGSGEVEFKVEQGDSGLAIADGLVKADVVKSSKAYLEAAKDDPRSTGIQPGTYQLKKQMSAQGALAVLVDPKHRITTDVTVREGLWASEVYATLSKQTGLPVADYEKAAKDAAKLGLPESAKGNVEGYLFPAVYSFEPGSTAQDQLGQMVAQSVKRLTALGVDPARMEHVVVVASLVEAEARREEDRPKVARVIENRLAKKMPLQLDSTVNYAVGKHGITTSDEDRASKSPYNTYVRLGLPPGPIGNPGESAIRAAVSPTAGSWLFFVTVNPDSGETKFATTYAEHQKYVLEFQTWCQAHKGTC